ncbi:SRPBCC family protein [soil metagenome]
MEFEASGEIDRRVEEVFAFVSEADNLTLWVPNVLEAGMLTEGPLAVGSRSRAVLQFLGRRFEVRFEVTALEPNRAMTFTSVDGPFPIEIEETFADLGGRTRVKIAMRAEPGGFFKVAQPVLSGMGKRQLDSSVGNLKDILEARSQAPHGEDETRNVPETLDR